MRGLNHRRRSPAGRAVQRSLKRLALIFCSSLITHSGLVGFVPGIPRHIQGRSGRCFWMGQGPQPIQIRATALDEAWEELRQSGSRLARPAYARTMREVVAKRIIDIAQRGVEDQEALVT